MDSSVSLGPITGNNFQFHPSFNHCRKRCWIWHSVMYLPVGLLVTWQSKEYILNKFNIWMHFFSAAFKFQYIFLNMQCLILYHFVGGGIGFQKYRKWKRDLLMKIFNIILWMEQYMGWILVKIFMILVLILLPVLMKINETVHGMNIHDLLWKYYFMKENTLNEY